jgi:hypothetical protein
MSKKFIPSRDRRPEALGLLWKSCLDDLEHRMSRYAHESELIIEEIGKRDVTSVSISLGFNFNALMQIAVCNFKKELTQDIQPLRKAFHLIHLAAKIWLLRRQMNNLDYQRPDDLYVSFFRLHGLAAYGQADFVSDGITSYLYHYLVKGRIRDYILGLEADSPFTAFASVLLSAAYEKHWPEHLDVKALGNFAGLLSNIHDSQAFEVALVDYCDFRMMQCLGYDSIDSIRRRSSATTKSFFDGQPRWCGVFPTELFTLQHIVKATTGRELSLTAPHPLLQTPLMQKRVAFLPLYQDEEIDRIDAFGAAEFGSDWKNVLRI